MDDGLHHAQLLCVFILVLYYAFCVLICYLESHKIDSKSEEDGYKSNEVNISESLKDQHITSVYV